MQSQEGSWGVGKRKKKAYLRDLTTRKKIFGRKEPL